LTALKSTLGYISPTCETGRTIYHLCTLAAVF
jgi:hypothetical protein